MDVENMKTGELRSVLSSDAEINFKRNEGRTHIEAHGSLPALLAGMKITMIEILQKCRATDMVDSILVEFARGVKDGMEEHEA